MRFRLASIAALFAVILAVAPAAAVTKGGVPDAGEHPMVGQLVFYVPDALPSPYLSPVAGSAAPERSSARRSS
jgi:hypothetical protein